MDEAKVTQWRAALLNGEILAVCAATGEKVQFAPPMTEKANLPRRLIFPGAFNPLHDGHREMADIATAESGLPVEFEISIQNVDKDAPSPADLVRRLQQFPPSQAAWLTSAMRFHNKAKAFPRATFVVGADTLARIADVAYYQDRKALERAIDEVAAHGGRFLVFARRINAATFDLDSLDVPRTLRSLCDAVPRTRFQRDISSTDIRIARDH